MKSIKRIIVMVIALLTTSTIFSVSSSVKEPDFAFPKKTSEQAQKDLNEAIQTSNRQDIIQSIIIYGLAETAIDPANATVVAKRMAEVASKEKSAVTRSLLNTLLAELYQQVYSYQRHVYDERRLPLTPLPENLAEWSGEQFKAEIASRLQSALESEAALLATPIANYSGIITADSLTRTYYPTLLDFTASRAIALLSSINRGNYTLNDRWMKPSAEFIELNTSILPSAIGDILKVYQTMLRAHSDQAGPRTNWDINRLTFVNGHLYSENNTPLITSLWELLDRLKPTQYSGMPLAAISALSRRDTSSRFLTEAREFVAKYPDFYTTPAIENTIASILAPSVEVSNPQVTAPGYATPVKISAKNTSRARIDIYLLPKTRNSYLSSRDLESGTKINSVNLEWNVTPPFAADTTVYVKLPRYGEYAIVPVIDDTKMPYNINTTLATNLSIAGASTPDMMEVIVADPVTGKPVSEAVISNREDYSANKKQRIGITDRNGLCPIPDSDSGRILWATKGDDTFSPSTNIWTPYSPQSQIVAKVLTSLPLYHPGDKLATAVVVYLSTKEENRTLADKTIDLVLYSPNYEQISKTAVKTDSWGRAEATFDLPSTGLTGQFQVAAKDGDDQISTTSVVVSDYKMPTMAITVEEPQVSPGKPVNLSGSVKTYSGFAIADSEVVLSISNVSPWRWWGVDNSAPFYSATVTTDAKGDFTFVIPQEVIQNAPMPEAIFSCALTATTPAGESQSTATSFINKRAYYISTSLPSSVDAATPAHIQSTIVVNDGSKMSIPLTLKISKDGKALATLPFPKDGKINFASFPSGKYVVDVYPTDTTSDIRGSSDTVTLYRLNDSHSPAQELLWTPCASVSANSNRRATLYFEVSKPDVMAFCIVTTANKLLRNEWMETHEGMNALCVELPEGEDEAQVKLYAIKDLEACTLTYSVLNDQFREKIDMQIVTFRDKVTPNTPETLTIKLSDRSGNPVAGAIMLDMWNKSLSALASHTFRINAWSLISPSININGGLRSKVSNSVNDNPRQVRTKTLLAPTFKLYDRSFGRPFYDNRQVRYAMKVSSSGPDGGVAGAAVLADDAVELDAANIVDMEQESSAKPKAETTPDGSGTYREAETPLAFFYPMLTSGDDGTLTLNYTVPNANATWILSAIAYNHQMLSYNLTREQVASKQVMVQPNPPRFLRMGDKAVITALVMNASDATQSIATTFEIFDPVTGDTLASSEFTTPCEAGQSATVSLTVDTPFDTTLLCYRIKSSTDSYSDGEQGLIPVLESITPVLESRNFYMGPSESSVTLPLPAENPGTQVTLQFCQNPTWYVVTALPGLRANTTNTANSAGAAIFSAAIADGLLKSHPEIKSVIHRWLTSERSDSMLVSMLAQNQDLKIALLSATPWMLDARSDTERMERLALLFDKKEIARVYATNIDALAKMQCQGGGWSWSPQYKLPSYWVTMNVLEGFGRLKRLGYLPDNGKLDRMIKNALEYVDRETVEEYRRYPSSDFTYYVSVRDLFADIKQSTAAAKVTEKTVKEILNEWKDYSVTTKGLAAIILHDHQYDATARNILASLREYATVSPSTGMWWPSLNNLGAWSRYSKLSAASILLEAFSTIEPQSASVDEIRQWIVMQKESQDWKDGVVTSEVVAAMLGSGSSWTVDPKGVNITINGSGFVPQTMTASTGYFRENITSSLTAEPGQLNITRFNATPAWGALFTRQPMVMGDIKAAPCEGLSIEKDIYLIEGTQVKAATDRPLKVGDRIRVDLLVKADKDMDYVVIIDQRAACMAPVEQLPAPIYEQGLCFYRENRDSSTNIYIDRLRAGTYRLSYELYVNNAGQYSSGTATIQSQYAPALLAHSAGSVLTVESK